MPCWVHSEGWWILSVLGERRVEGDGLRVSGWMSIVGSESTADAGVYCSCRWRCSGGRQLLCIFGVKTGIKCAQRR